MVSPYPIRCCLALLEHKSFFWPQRFNAPSTAGVFLLCHKGYLLKRKDVVTAVGRGQMRVRPFPAHDFRCTILLGKTSSAAGGGGSRFCHNPIRRGAGSLDGVLPTSPIFAQNHYPERTSFIPGLLERAQASGSDPTGDSRVGKMCVTKTEPFPWK